MCGTEIPAPFVKYVNNKSEDDMYNAGLEYAINQIQDLINNGINNIHLYTMNKGEVAKSIYEVFDKYR